MQILVLNAGSTSLKYKLFDRESLNVLKKGYFENLPDGGRGHEQAFRTALREISNLTDIKAVGHRIVHGGPDFREPVLLNEQILKALSKYNHLAPLHNPYNLAVANRALIYLSGIPHVGCFDTGFFANLPDKAKIYALPLEYFEKYNIQRFGFHGISHEYVAEEAAKILGKSLSKINLITCHLGGGCSISATLKGKPVDTSMGFTPLEGLVMMNRSGDVDPGLIFYLSRECGLALGEIDDLLNHRSGMKGLAGTSDFLKVLKARQWGKKNAKLAFDIFVYRIQKYISAYWGILGGAQAIVFTGAIGAGKAQTRQAICRGLKFLKKTKILAIPTDEELAIARECLKFLK